MPYKHQFLPSWGPAEGTCTPSHIHLVLGRPLAVTFEDGGSWNTVLYLTECLFLFTPDLVSPDLPSAGTL